MRKRSSIFKVGSVAAIIVAGCSHSQPPMYMSPPITPVTVGQSGGQGPTYNWTEVPVNQKVPITSARFDQGGYQIYDQAGDTIIVPFANQNLNVMKFGQSTDGTEYFINEKTFPILYLPPGGYLDNAAAQGAHWYPFPQNYQYTQPVFVGMAPSWSAFTSMGWYPGMSYYGGYWGYHPYGYGYGFAPMIGLHFLIGGQPYYGFNSYHSYYASHPYNRVVNHTVFNYGSFHGRSSGGAFGGSRFGTSAARGTGSFGSGRSFGTSGSFGSGARSFGSTGRTSSGSFGTRGSGFGGSFGGQRPAFGSGGSFGGQRPAFGSGGSFGGQRPAFGSGGSFGGQRPALGGGGSFGGGGRSFGGFGGGGRSFGGFGGGGRSFGGGFRHR